MYVRAIKFYNINSGKNEFQFLLGNILERWYIYYHSRTGHFTQFIVSQTPRTRYEQVNI